MDEEYIKLTQEWHKKGFESRQTEIEELKEKLAMYEREGYKLVPVRCNNKMAHAAKTIDGRLSAFKYGDVWETMINATD